MALFSRGFLRKRVISFATTMAVAVGPQAFAQDARSNEATGKLDEQHFVLESDLAVSKMDRGMIGNESGDVDQDFVATMIPHHQGAIDIARAELKYGHDQKLKQLAQAIVSEQQQEIQRMRADGLALIHSTADPVAAR